MNNQDRNCGMPMGSPFPGAMPMGMNPGMPMGMNPGMPMGMQPGMQSGMPMGMNPGMSNMNGFANPMMTNQGSPFQGQGNTTGGGGGVSQVSQSVEISRLQQEVDVIQRRIDTLDRRLTVVEQTVGVGNSMSVGKSSDSNYKIV